MFIYIYIYIYTVWPEILAERYFGGLLKICHLAVEPVLIKICPLYYYAALQYIIYLNNNNNSNNSSSNKDNQ